MRNSANTLELFQIIIFVSLALFVHSPANFSLFLCVKMKDTEEVYNVERIIAKRKNKKGAVTYLTKWYADVDIHKFIRLFRRGYDKEEDNSWEPIESFKHCRWVVEEFEAEQQMVKAFENDLINEFGKVPEHLFKKRPAKSDKPATSKSSSDKNSKN
jgi:hypothetical protein